MSMMRGVSIALTGCGVHVSMISLDFSNSWSSKPATAGASMTTFKEDVA